MMVELAFPAAICRATDRAVLMGIANPAADCCCSPLLTLCAAVSMPMTWLAELDSGPPESPGWMSALVWIMPCSVSLLAVPPWSEAVMVRFRPVTCPAAGTTAP